MKRIVLNKYIHQPIQILWFDQNEIFIFIAAYMFGMMGGGVFWCSLLVTPFFIKYKRKQNRGYFNQLIYFYGFRKMKGYPDPSEKRFYE
jgi:hypothetical protein